MPDDFVSQLPLYQARWSQEYPDFLIVTCGYEDCPGTIGNRPFLVAAKEWLRPIRRVNRRTDKVTVVVGRSCPYCFRAGRIPARRHIGA